MPEPRVFAQAAARREEILDHALLHGLLKRDAAGRLVHAPFSLTPCPIDAANLERLAGLTPAFNRLALAVARDGGFLADALAQAARTDAFTATLLRLARASAGSQPLALQVVRSDYFLHAGPAGPHPVQVELNTMAASYPALSARVNAVHAYLYAGTELEGALVPNDPLAPICEAMVQALARYGHPAAAAFMVVQPDEANIFDQRLLQFALRARGVAMERITLAEIGREGRLREGHLVLRGRPAGLVYFRAGYAPEDLADPDALAGRERIAHSSAIEVPTLHAQLAGAKKVQQVLTEPAVLRRFCGEDDAAALAATFAGLYGLDQPIGPHPAAPTAADAALADPAAWVLKPQREGGGNNFFDAELTARLRSLPPDERHQYILMERIRPLTHFARTYVDRAEWRGTAVSEIGRYGVLLAEGTRVLLNADTGYLVRTKPEGVQEGGVSAGFGHLNSLYLADPARPLAAD